MATYKKRPDFFVSEEGGLALLELKAMATNAAYNTESSYSANSTLHPDHIITFVDKHMAYLNTHPTIDPNQYISNLKLMTRVR